jgi:hypothetical protein
MADKRGFTHLAITEWTDSQGDEHQVIRAFTSKVKANAYVNARMDTVLNKMHYVLSVPVN